MSLLLSAWARDTPSNLKTSPWSGGLWQRDTWGCSAWDVEDGSQCSLLRYAAQRSPVICSPYTSSTAAVPVLVQPSSVCFRFLAAADVREPLQPNPRMPSPAFRWRAVWHGKPADPTAGGGGEANDGSSSMMDGLLL